MTLVIEQLSMQDDGEKFVRLRKEMIERQIVARGISNSHVLKALERIPRHLFVPAEYLSFAYADKPLPLGPEQTISQPYIVALMLEELNLQPTDRVLEIGTGSGYQTALLAWLAKEVYSIEIDKTLAESADSRLTDMGFSNIQIKQANGYSGWREEAPFDKVVLSASTKHIPRQLVKQLKLGGRIIMPLGEEMQVLVSIDKQAEGLESRELGGVRFVQMVEE